MKTITRLKTISQHVAPLELEDRRTEFFYKHRAPTGASGNAANFFSYPFYRFARRVSDQKPVDDFLHAEGQIRLGKRQARRQGKIVADTRFKIARILAPLGAKCL